MNEEDIRIVDMGFVKKLAEYYEGQPYHEAYNYVELLHDIINKAEEEKQEVVIESDIRNGFHYVKFTPVDETPVTLVKMRSEGQDYYDGAVSRESARKTWNALISDGFMMEELV